MLLADRKALNSLLYVRHIIQNSSAVLSGSQQFKFVIVCISPPVHCVLSVFPGTGCQICLAAGQEQILCGPQDVSPFPLPHCPAGQQGLLCPLPGPLSQHLAGVCALHQPQEGSVLHYMIPKKIFFKFINQIPINRSLKKNISVHQYHQNRGQG